MKWNKCDEILPINTGDEHSYLITDGKQISIGWYEEEFNEPEAEGLSYSSATWYDDTSSLNTCISGFPIVTHWAFLPALPDA